MHGAGVMACIAVVVGAQYATLRGIATIRHACPRSIVAFSSIVVCPAAVIAGILTVVVGFAIHGTGFITGIAGVAFGLKATLSD